MTSSERKPGAAVGVAICAASALVALALGVALGFANFVFMPQMGPWFPVSGLGLIVSIYALYGALPAAVCAGVIAIAAGRRRGLSRAQLLLGLASFGWLGLTLGTLAGWRSFEHNTERRLTEAISYCDALRPELESYRAAHGAYPARLSDVAGSGERPMLLRTGDTTYYTDAEHYVLKVNTSRGLAFIGAKYDSATGIWTR